MAVAAGRALVGTTGEGFAGQVTRTVAASVAAAAALVAMVIVTGPSVHGARPRTRLLTLTGLCCLGLVTVGLVRLAGYHLTWLENSAVALGLWAGAAALTVARRARRGQAS